MEDALLTIIVVAITWKWGDWRRLRQYYSTILFLALGDYICLYFTFDKPLWRFTTIIPTKLAETMMALLIFPCVVLLFLPYFPKKNNSRKLLYICIWTSIFSLIEWWALRIHHFVHFNEWKLTYSVAFNLGMFTLIQIHYKKPLWAWSISLVTAIFIITVFKIPLS